MTRKSTGKGRPRSAVLRSKGEIQAEIPLAPEKIPESVEELEGHLAAAGYLTPLLEELGDRAVCQHGRLVLARKGQRPAWALNSWQSLTLLPIQSVRDGARQLRAIQRNWVPYPVHLHRRSALLQDALPYISAKPVHFPAPPPSAPLGTFTLLDKNVVLASPRCSSIFPNGEARFEEDRVGPASRAYLKLWEALTLAGEMPTPGQRCLDLGASPGGWTWVLARLGAEVTAVDKAPLAPRVSKLQNVTALKASAFSLDPESVGTVDWVFSDIACYPEKLLELVTRWMNALPQARFVCSVKFQGPTDHSTAARFTQIPGSRLLHLHHNKHELTWIKLA